MSTTTDFEILEELGEIFEEDHRTIKYTIGRFDDPDHVPHPDMCPYLNILPTKKGRTLERIGGSTPYNSAPTFEVKCWQMGLNGYKDAFGSLVIVEENVYAVLRDNQTINNKVSNMVIGETIYEYERFRESFYIVATVPVTLEVDK